MPDGAMDADGVTPWAPLPFPSRPSRHYTLKSIAFCKDAEPSALLKGTAKGLQPTPRAHQLPRLQGDADGNGNAASWAVSSMGVSIDAGVFDTNPMVVKLSARREAALAEHTKVEEQLKQVSLKLTRERRMRVEGEVKAKDVRERMVAVVHKCRDETQRLYAQQQELRALRAQLKQLQQDGGASASTALPHASHGYLDNRVSMQQAAPVQVPYGRVVPAPSPSQQAGAFNAFPSPPPGVANAAATPVPMGSPLVGPGEMSPGPGPRSDLGVPGSPSPKRVPSKGTRGRDAAKSPTKKQQADRATGLDFDKPSTQAAQVTESGVVSLDVNVSVDAGLEGLLDEIGKFTKACVPVKGTASKKSGGKKATKKEASNSKVEDEEEAEIELLRQNSQDGSSPGVTLARLRHPSASEVLVDLSDALPLVWRLSDGRTVTPGNLPVLWPVSVDRTAKGAMVPWVLALLDDSNNEPSATLTCDGGAFGHWWKVQRTIIVCANSLREDVCIENVSDVKQSFCVGTESKDPIEASLNMPVVELKRRLQDGSDGSSLQAQPISVELPPQGKWSETVLWLPQ
eukprot:TRINITY_DN79967_c0_g1_i1.p1 TRINITY_DN79967_c0_g1~~TRINITY_DN79967_c0_g1_i1.p1  ORF type:complete len:570 (+),score=118.80 TRINITY_DN79967_c0_g1_i1:46-1755(+)